MEERIKYLFGKYLQNTCTKEEYEELFFYIRQDATDPAIRQQIRALYEEGSQALPSSVYVGTDGTLKGAEMQEMPPLADDGPVRAAMGRKKLVMTAILLAVLLTGGLYWKRWHSGQSELRLAGAKRPGQHELLRQTTRPSEYRYLLLPDSTQVWLNAASTLEFPETFGKSARKVVLTGEAFFDVKHADKIPFIIYTGTVSTEVLGTSFNIKAYPDMDKITVSVKRGKVKVNYAQREVATLTMGHQICIGKKDNSVREKNLKADEAASWQNGKLVYDDYAIEDIVTDLERIYNVRIRIENASIRGLRISTTFKRNDGPYQALEVLAELTDTKLFTNNGEYNIR